MRYEIKFVRGHVEVYDREGNFVFSADTGFAAAGCRPENPLRCSENLYHKGHCVFIIDDVRKGIGTAVLAIDGPANGMT